MKILSYKDTKPKSVGELVRLGDLVFFEGPLLTLFKSISTNSCFLFDWVDRGVNSNRWLIYKVSPTALLKFINEQISHLELFESNPDKKFYVIDIESGHLLKDYSLIEIYNVPFEYVPNNDFYFAQSECLDFHKISAAVNKLISFTKQSNSYLTYFKTYDFQHYISFSAHTRKARINKLHHSYENYIFHNSASYFIINNIDDNIIYNNLNEEKSDILQPIIEKANIAKIDYA